MSFDIISIVIYSILATAVLTFAVTKLFLRPIKHQVVEVKEIVRTPAEIVTYKRDFIIDEREFRMRYGIEEKMMVFNRAKEDLWVTIPNECFEVVEWEGQLNRRMLRSPDEKGYTIFLKVLPPPIKKDKQ